jgi:hypothetical protein
LGGIIEPAADDRLQRRDYVGGLGDEHCALLEQAVCTFGARIERRARHGEDLAPLFAGEARGDQRARPARRLDDDDAERQTGDQAVAPWEVARARLPGERHFRHGGALGDERLR